MAITLVQSKSADAGSVTSTTLAFTSNVTAGSLKTCLIRTGNGSATNSASDNVNGSYTQDSLVVSGPGGANVTSSINSKPNASAGATTTTASQSVTATLRLVIQEVSGIATTSPLDQTTSNGGSSTSPASGSVTTTTASEFLCGFVCGNNGVANAITAGSGWTQDQQLTASADRLLSEYQIVSSTGSYNATATIGASDIWISQIATYKAAAGGALTLALTGQSSTFTAGSLTPSTTIGLTGSQGTFTAGTLTASIGGNVTVALIGQAMSIGIGIISVGVTVPLTGGSFTSTSGTLSPANATSLTGSSVATAPGTLTPSRSLGLIGQAASLIGGTVIPGATFSLNGTLASFQLGVLNPSLTIPLTGTLQSISAGQMTSSGGDSLVTQTCSLLLIRRGSRKKR